MKSKKEKKSDFLQLTISKTATSHPPYLFQRTVASKLTQSVVSFDCVFVQTVLVNVAFTWCNIFNFSRGNSRLLNLRREW